jgi:hypothetical protein
MARGQRGQLDAPVGEERVRADKEGVGPLSHKRCVGIIDLLTGTGIVKLSLQPEDASSRFKVAARGLRPLWGQARSFGNVRLMSGLPPQADLHASSLQVSEVPKAAIGLPYSITASARSRNDRRSAGYVAKILKGTKPSELPVQQPTRFELAVNLKTAKTLGVTLPASLIGQADEVAE